MAEYGVLLGILVVITGQYGFASSQRTYECKTFGSGIIQTFNMTMFHVRTTCPVVLSHFSHVSVEFLMSVQRDPTGLMRRVEILVNKIVTVIQDGKMTVEGNSVSLPYDHTYQSIYTYGIYTRLASKVLPLSVTWFSVPEGITSLWVQLDRPLVDGMTGMCGGVNSSENRAQLLDRYIKGDECITGDPQPEEDQICKNFKSYGRACLGRMLHIYDQLCGLNMHGNVHESVKCSFYEEFIRSCNHFDSLQVKLREVTSCGEYVCPGDLQFKDKGAAFPPTCSNPQLQTESHTSTCLPPDGLVLNDRAEGYHSVKVEDCPCVHRGRNYNPGEKRSSKCQTCECVKGKWNCSANICETPCAIEGFFVTTFDGKQYSLPGKCTYMAAMGHNWTVTIKLSDMTTEKLYLDVYQERYTFSLNTVQLRENPIMVTDLSQTDHVTVYWQSSMFVKVQTTFGLKMQVQVSPEIQMYLYLPQNVTSTGLCGSNNNNTDDDFTTSSGIVEDSTQSFALSWALGDCTPNIPTVCINIDNEIFAEEKCSQMTNKSGVFAQCHDFVPVNTYFDACIQRTCHATSGLQKHACVGLEIYAKACASQGINVGDWRAETACTPSCVGNLRFDYAMQACNRTCRSLSGADPTCDMPDDPVEGCGCPPGTYLDTPLKCSPHALCHCSYPGGTVPPGPVVIDGHQCMCENGQLQCLDFCDCPHGQICVHCAQAPVKTTQRTCESLMKPSIADESCISGCYCPEGQYADHTGNCVIQENCTCEFSGIVYRSGNSVESNCKRCTCRGGQWECEGDKCPGVCKVFGNGQYKTFDSRWYRFDGHCQYTLAEDISGRFSIKSESVPCCDQVLTCSRIISVKLMDNVSLILKDMNVTHKFLDGWHFEVASLYSVHAVGLNIIITVPIMGLNVIWDKQTKVIIELDASWNGKVQGLCGNFDGKLMNDFLMSSSTEVLSTLEFGNSWKTAGPPCSDVTHELFPCEHHSYCAAWAQRRCMILLGDIFEACHFKVDPKPYYLACVLESCSCDFEGKFLGFCTAVAAYADACTIKDVCIKWRTPDLCPVYCDYYNEEGQCSWHYEACPRQIKTCGKNNKFFEMLEGCYPRCPADFPYYDENRRICSSLDNCTCLFNNTVVGPRAKVTTATECCDCIEGQIICDLCPPLLHTTTENPETSVPGNTTLYKTINPTTTKTTVTVLSSTLYTSTGETVTPTTTITPKITTTKTTIKPQTMMLLTMITTQATETTTTTKTATTLITTEKYKTTSPLTTTMLSKTPTTPEITTKESTFTTQLNTTSTTSETPVTTSSTKSTTVPKTMTPRITASTNTSLVTTITMATPTPEITTKESTFTTAHIPTSNTSETPVTTSSTKSTTAPKTTTPLTTASTNTPLMTTSTMATPTPEITTKESTFITPHIPTSATSATSETPVTTSSTKSTTATNTTTPLTTASTNTPLMTTSTMATPTPEITTRESTFTTPHTPTSTNTQLTPTVTTVITTSWPSTTIGPDCKDLIRNYSWPDGYQWTEDCFNKVCRNGVIELRPLICPIPVVPVCPRGMPHKVKDKQGCCDIWQCDCQCDLFGDPHYISFAGQTFQFLENCTYILVEERTPNHNLRISVDNYYCEPFASCAKGIILNYHYNTVILQVLQSHDGMPRVETFLNYNKIKPPYEIDGIRIETTDAEVYIYIEEIRSYIFLSIWNTLQINLAMEHFLNNTQGQCGICGGASCIRRNGSIESGDCCDKTAYEWIEDDPLKPYCQEAPRHVPCFTDKPPTPTVSPTPPCIAPVCELLRHEVFSKCSQGINIERLVSNCKFDYCGIQNNATVCSSLEHLADHCKKIGFCVAWRNLTNGICDITCSNGMVFNECRSTQSDFCRGGVRVQGKVLDTERSGCFCPDYQLLAEQHKHICVSNCTSCKGSLGEPMPAGAIWESNCHICTCNTQTLTEECWPKPLLPTPTCSPGSALISGCCNSQKCVEKTCEYNGTVYKVGETWRDPESPCVAFNCTKEGIVIEKMLYPQQFCPEELCVWDEYHCCSSCNTTCGVKLSRMTIKHCSQEVLLPICEGDCSSGSMWVRSGKDLQLDHSPFFCQETDYELRQISVVCNGTTPTQYTYKHITSCECQSIV